MTDGIIKGTGNSRYLKTVRDAMTLYPTYESFIQALVAGTLPIDLNGINAAGWTTVGTALGKATMLSDETAGMLGMTGDATVDGALNRLHAGLELRSMVKLFDVSPAGTSSVSLDLTGLDMNDFSALRIYWGGNINVDNITSGLWVRINENTSGYFNTSSVPGQTALSSSNTLAYGTMSGTKGTKDTSAGTIEIRFHRSADGTRDVITARAESLVVCNATTSSPSVLYYDVAGSTMPGSFGNIMSGLTSIQLMTSGTQTFVDGTRMIVYGFRA